MATVHLFIDTNIFLNFFGFSKDDLDELQKLVELVRLRRIKLYLTQNVVDEFYRNRETKLAKSLADYSQWKLPPCPSFMLPLDEYERFNKSAAEFEKAQRALVDKARANAESKNLMADGIFAGLQALAGVIPTDQPSYEAAFRRFNLGNPPGKEKGVGDQLNWELLLKHVPENNNLQILSNDGDYASKLTPTIAKAFLEDEWLEKKSARINIYEQLGEFFAQNFPEKDFSLDIEKREAIERLVDSGSFARTHAAVARLHSYVGFLTPEEVEEIIQKSLENNQVYRLMTDTDVNGFFRRLLAEHAYEITEKLKRKLIELLG